MRNEFKSVIAHLGGLFVVAFIISTNLLGIISSDPKLMIYVTWTSWVELTGILYRVLVVASVAYYFLEGSFRNRSSNHIPRHGITIHQINPTRGVNPPALPLFTNRNPQEPPEFNGNPVNPLAVHPFTNPQEPSEFNSPVAQSDED
jgi:hypothetical protein